MLRALLVIVACYNGFFVRGATLNSIVTTADKSPKLAAFTLTSLKQRANLEAKSGLLVNGGDDVDTAKGVKLRRLVQTFGDYEVYGTNVAAELSLDGQYTGHMTGDIVTDLVKDIPDTEVCKKSLDEMLAVALSSEGYSLNDHRIKNEDGRRIVYFNRDNSKGKMAYVINFFVEEIISNPLYIIDACDNSVYVTYNLINNATINRQDQVKSAAKNKDCGTCSLSVPGYGGNQKTGRVKYNVPPRCLKVAQSGSTCRMQSTYVKVVNNMGSTSRSKTSAISFTCSSGYNDPYGNKNGAHGTANDAMYFGHVTGEFYKTKYSFKALPWTPRLVIHYGRNFENAFWTGSDMFFGDGGSYFYPLVCLDVIAHELAHGITSTNSKLEYRSQSGGINEAFSDISGEVIEYYSRRSNDFLVGADIMKRTTALRYFEDPTDDGRSIKHVRNYRNGMDVHYSSGIYNHAFWRMVKVYKMPMYDAYKCFLDANRSRWGRNTGFSSGACHVARACYSNGFNHVSVKKAFVAVGVSFSGCSLSLHEATIFSSQSRSNILVRADRSPILELNLDKGKSTIEAVAADKSDISLIHAKDEEAKEVVNEAINKLVVDSPKDGTIVYIKLRSQNIGDVKVKLMVE